MILSNCLDQHADGEREIHSEEPLRAAPQRPPCGRGTTAVLLLLFAAQLARTAWMSDDAYISLRMADHLVDGRGFVWNAGERVLAVTNPLWTLLLAGGYALTGEGFFGPLALSVAVSLAALGVLVRWIAPSARAAVLGASVLLLSASFVDYSTSGLENPLVHLLLGAFLAVYWRGRGRRALGWMSLLAGLGLLARPDTALLFGPPLAARLLRRPERAAATAVALGALPFVLWCAFALVYFGSPLPNTALAKLDSGVPGLWVQGLRYLQISGEADPLLAVAIVVAPLAAIRRRVPGAGPIALGIALDVVYTVAVGGDFMAGRFLTGALYCAVALLVSLPLPDARRLAPALAAVLLLALVAPIRSHWLDGGPWSRRDAEGQRPLPRYGIVDERRWYHDRLGLVEVLRGEATPPMAPAGSDAPGRARAVAVEATVGVGAFARGPDVHVVDLHALTDPLLARLPVVPSDWRPGHPRRIVPAGYLATLRSGHNEIEDPAVAALYEELERIHRGPIFDAARWRAIPRLLLGGRGAVDTAYYRNPPRIVVRADRLRRGEPRSFLLPGVTVRWERAVHPRALRLELSEQHDFQVTFLLEGQPLATRLAPATRRAGTGLAARTIEVPDPLRARGFDAVVVATDTWYSDQQFRIGGLELVGADG